MAVNPQEGEDYHETRKAKGWNCGLICYGGIVGRRSEDFKAVPLPKYDFLNGQNQMDKIETKSEQHSHIIINWPLLCVLCSLYF